MLESVTKPSLKRRNSKTSESQSVKSVVLSLIFRKLPKHPIKELRGVDFHDMAS